MEIVDAAKAEEEIGRWSAAEDRRALFPAAGEIIGKLVDVEDEHCSALKALLAGR